MTDPRNRRFADRYWRSADELNLHYRDYAPANGGGSGADRPPVLCLPGLTRNARDFEGAAERLSDAGWRVIAVNLRGRGGSAAAKDPATYAPATYADDVTRLLDELGLARVVVIGTSLGGIVAMLLGLAAPDRIAGAVLNDVGPVIEAEGLARIRAATGRGGWWPTWMHAARAVAEVHGAAFPEYRIEDWLRMAKRLNRLNSAGRIVPDYDARIAEPFRTAGGEAAVDLWPGFDRLADKPLLVVRAARSDILSAASAEAMLARAAGAALVTVPGIGHAPTLDEPAAVAAIDDLLARVSVEPAPA